MAACPGVVSEPHVWSGGGRTWQNYCRTLGLVEFRRAEGPASMRNHVTEREGRGSGGRRMVRASGCPSGCPAGSAVGHTSTTSEKPFNLGSRAPTHRAVINACLSFYLQPGPVKSVFKRQ